MKRCYYEVLGVEQDAGTGQIKKAFYKQALEWHPDKNSHRLDEATERFKEVQNAYSVLSDPHERAWYDEHREAILRGGDGTCSGEGGDGAAAAYEVNLWPYFAPSCFRSFDAEDEAGFWAVYQAAFDRVTETERAGSNTPRDPPRFGGPETPWPQVGAFYQYWDSFVSNLTFAWRDVWNPREASGRPERRAMERENRKARAKAKRQFVEQVRALAHFVRRRDPRIHKRQQEVAQEKEARRVAAAKREEQRREHLRRQREEWLRQVEEEEEEEEVPVDEVEAAMEDLLRQHEAGEINLFEDEGGEEGEEVGMEGEGDVGGTPMSQSTATSGQGRSRKKKKKKNKHSQQSQVPDSSGGDASVADTPLLAGRSSRKKAKKRAKRQAARFGGSGGAEHDHDHKHDYYHEDGEDHAMGDGHDHGDGHERKHKGLPGSDDDDTDAREREHRDRDDHERVDAASSDGESGGSVPIGVAVFAGGGVRGISDSEPEPDDVEAPAAEVTPAAEYHSEDGGEEQDASAAQAAEPRRRRRRRRTKGDSGAVSASAASQPRSDYYACKVCSTGFTSRNRLFAHIKKTGHAAYKS